MADCERACAGIEYPPSRMPETSGRVTRVSRAPRYHGALAIAAALVLLATPGVAVARSARSAEQRAAVCQRIPGRTMMRQGEVRIFRASGVVYGCVNGSQSAWALWQPSPTLSGSVAQVNRQFVAVKSQTSDQYEFDASLAVVDLRSGRSYPIASESEPLDGPVTGNPSTPGPWPIEAFALGSDGLAVRLYERFTAGTSEQSATVVGQVLDVIGFQHLHRWLATSPPGEIAPVSVHYEGHKVTWTQDGSRHAANV